jgi:thiosulfate reductase cytochrome b subunit
MTSTSSPTNKIAAFLLGWMYTCILFVMAPLIAATGVLMAISMEDGFKKEMKSYGQSAGYAEQAL